MSICIRLHIHLSAHSWFSWEPKGEAEEGFVDAFGKGGDRNQNDTKKIFKFHKLKLSISLGNGGMRSKV